MSQDIISLIETHVNFNQKEIILDFLKKEKYFFSIINGEYNDDIEKNELINLGRDLNILRETIKYDTKEFSNLNEYLSYIGLQAIISLKYIPKAYRMFYLNEEFSGISGQKISEIYSVLYKKYQVITSVYTKNGEFGLSKYIFLNKKMFELYNKNISDFLNLNIISIEDIINFTSMESDINKYTTTYLAKKIYNKELTLQSKNTIYL